jgi:beta-mannosidase
MEKLSLNGAWQMAMAGSYDWMEATVPGSVMCELLKHGKMEDPYYRDNEKIAMKWMEKDYEYRREFTVDESLLAHDRVLLRCYGLDTIADIFLNGEKVASVNDMHRTYEFDVKNYLKAGQNEIRIYFSSALVYVRKRAKEQPLPVNIVRATDGFAYLRKASNMFGWDSEPEIPDMGIWRDIELAAYDTARMDTFYLRQWLQDGSLQMQIEIPVEYWNPAEKLETEVVLVSPTGEAMTAVSAVKDGKAAASFMVDHPMLWWPNGYGGQPLYQLKISLKQGDVQLDNQERAIGLRTMKVRKEQDEYGESFEIQVNGVPIFAKGADYIPLDKFLPRETKERLEQMFQDSVEANYNCIRIWGGGIFPSDDFYDLADRYGILLWQDFLFACTLYPLSEEFEENIIAETRDNIKRLRHHACLALWCGNNENEWLYDIWEHPKTIETRRDYIRTFEFILADVAKEYDPDRLYYPSSPSSQGFYQDPNGPYAGDIHMWDVWHNAIKPYEAYKEYPSRFTSEFGLQSFPNWKTIKEVTLPEDREVSSYIMDYHQRNSNGYGNAQIMYYVLQDLPYPKTCEMAVYASQVMQAEGVRFGSEFYRRIRGRCAGSMYWQIGDCWQAPTWSSIDYSGRWKALHYRAHHFYAPLLLSLDKEGDRIDVYVVSDKVEKTAGAVEWKLMDASSQVVKQGIEHVEICPLSSQCMFSLEIPELLEGQDEKEVYLEARLMVEGTCVNENHYLFVKPKHFCFREAGIRAKIQEQEDAFLITVTADAFAMYVYLELEQDDCHFSDNYFNLSKGTKEVTVEKSRMSRLLSLKELKEQLVIRTVADIGK